MFDFRLKRIVNLGLQSVYILHVHYVLGAKATKRVFQTNTTEPSSKHQKTKLPETLAEEIEYIVKSLMAVEKLVNIQSIQLFRAIVTYLYKCLLPLMWETQILCISVHAFAQLVVDLDEDNNDYVTLEIESYRGSRSRLLHKIPKWLVRGMKLYYLDVRPHFVSHEGKTII